MSVDLTQYHRIHENRLQFCTLWANDLIQRYMSKQCCEDCEMSGTQDISEDISKATFGMYVEMLEAVLYSSGYWCFTHIRKHGNILKVHYKMKKMTAEEVERGHNPPAPAPLNMD